MRNRRSDHHRICILFILLSGLLCLAGCKERADHATKTPTSYAIDNSYDKGPLTVHVRVDAEQVKLSGLLTLELSATIGSEYEVQFPAVAESLKQFGIRDWKDMPDITSSDTKQTTKTKQYRLEPLEAGTCDIPALTFQFKRKDAADEKETATLTTIPGMLAAT